MRIATPKSDGEYTVKRSPSVGTLLKEANLVRFIGRRQFKGLWNLLIRLLL